VKALLASTSRTMEFCILLFPKMLCK